MSKSLQNPDLHQSGFWVFIGFLGRNVLHFVQCRQKPVVSQDFPPCSWILFFFEMVCLGLKKFSCDFCAFYTGPAYVPQRTSEFVRFCAQTSLSLVRVA